MEDKDIVDLYWQRSEQAIIETKDKYEPLLFSVASNILTSREDKEEREEKELAKTISDFLRKENSLKRNIFLRRYYFYDSIDKNDDYHFIDLYLNKTYSIPRTDGARIAACWASRSLIYVMEDTGSHKVYFIDVEKAVDFGADTFADLDVVEGMHEFGENRYIITGYSGEEQVAYLLKLPER